MKLIFSDRKIIEALQSADDFEMDRAFRMLYKTYFRMALHYVKSNSGGDVDAEDVFQDALVGFYENVRKGNFKGESTIKTYLYAMIRNQWLVKLKKNMRNINMEIPEKTLGGMYSMSSENPVDELQFRVSDLLGHISERCREVLKLYYFDNFSMTDIAMKANFDNENSAKTQKYKCMQRLIKILEDKPELKKALVELMAQS